MRDEGLALLASGGGDGALERLAAAAALCHGLAEAHLNLARAFRSTGRWEAARHALALARRRAIDNKAGNRIFGEIDLETGALPSPPPERDNFKKDQVLYSSLTGNRWTVVAEPMLGGLGAVYKVRDHDDTRIYALKTFQSRFIWSDDDRRRFEREAALWMKLAPHPNIVTAEWVEVIEDFPCIVQEFVEGGDLANLLRTQDLAIPRALEFGIQFCDGMSFAHDSTGLVHRDVKPSNCLLTARGMLKVGDFGISRCVSDVVASAFSFCRKTLARRYS